MRETGRNGGREAMKSSRENKCLWSTCNAINLASAKLLRKEACLGLLKRIEMLSYLSYFII